MGIWVLNVSRILQRGPIFSLQMIYFFSEFFDIVIDFMDKFMWGKPQGGGASIVSCFYCYLKVYVCRFTFYFC